MNIITLAEAKFRSLNKCKSMTGSLCRHSQIDHEIPVPLADHREHDDEIRLQPVIALAFIENNLQSAETKRHQAQADVVDLEFVDLAALEIAAGPESDAW